MKKTSLFVLIAATLLHACGNNESSTSETNGSDTSTMGTTAPSMSSDNQMADTSGTTPMRDTTSSMNATPPAKDVTDFVMKAASGGMLEVELGQAAQDNAKSQRIKDFGNMLVTDHTKANSELKSLASSKNITVPTALMPAHQKHVDMLKGKTGAAFDKAYIDMMTTDHKKDIADFKKASESSTDADIKSFASKTLPVLEKHLDSVQAIKSSM